MTYHAMNAYYTFSPGEIMSGFGRMSPNSYYTFRPHEIMSGFGAAKDTFSPDAVMADIAITNTCWGPGGTGKASGACNAASQRASNDIAVALNALGYGPIPVDGSLKWQSAYNQFLSDHGLEKGPGLGVTKQALLKMQQLLQQGKTPGPGEVVEHEKVGGEFVPVDKGIGRAGLALGLLAVAAVGGIALVASRKKKRKAR